MKVHSGGKKRKEENSVKGGGSSGVSGRDDLRTKKLVTVMYTNCQSINNKRSELRAYLSD